MIEYIDTHTHLYDAAFSNDIDAVIKRALIAGVRKCIVPAIDKRYHKAMVDLADIYPDLIMPAIGIHPTSINREWKEEIQFIESEIDKREFVAIGEIGMDGYWSKEFLKEQSEAFAIQMELAASRDLPVIIHLREATEELFSVLDSLKRDSRTRGVFHAFSGSIESYKRIKRYGDFKVGIGGVLTFKNASIVQTLKDIDLSDILIETDSPWLSPVPYRGKRNEPSYIPLIASKIAEIKNMPIEKIAFETTKNTLNLLKK